MEHPQTSDEIEIPKLEENVTDTVKPTWNSLEIAKLVVGAVTSILIFVYGQQFTNEREKFAEAREKYSQVTKKRVELWDKLAIGLNEIYCYHLYVGRWKELSPSDILKRKRELDQLIYSYRPFFSDQFFAKYDDFIKSTFRTYREWGKDASLRTRQIRPKDEGYDPEAFENEDNSKEVFARYFDLLKFAATELDTNIPLAGAAGPPKTPQTKADIAAK